jgi:hypothetical protein
MAQLSEWLKLMVAEINRKQEEADRAREEELARRKDPKKEVPRVPAKAHPQRC